MDALKILSFLIVLLHHFQAELRNFGMYDIDRKYLFYLTPNMDFLGVGICIFFMASGAALMTVYGKKMDIRRFAIHTFTRILIPYYIAYILYVGIAFLTIGRLPYEIDLPLWEIIWTVLGLDGYLLACGKLTLSMVGEWFLGALLILYAAFPLLRLMMIKCRWALTIITGVIFVYLSVFYPFAAPLPHMNVLIKAFDFVMGMLIIQYKDSLCRLRPGILAGSAVIVCALTNMEFFMKIPYTITMSAAAIAIFLIAMQAEGLLRRSAAFCNALTAVSNWVYEIFVIHHVTIAFSLYYMVVISGVQPFDKKGVFVFGLCVLAGIILYAGIVRGLSSLIRKAMDHLRIAFLNYTAE